MRAAVVLSVLLTAVPSTVLPGQEKEKPSSPPKKGEAVVVRGCLTGSALEATNLGSSDVIPELSSGITFRLTGDRTLLKQMRDKHDGRIVEVEGILKSDLPQENVHTRKVGKMRITIGSPAANPGSPQAETRRSLPVLEVKSFDGSTTSCGR